MAYNLSQSGCRRVISCFVLICPLISLRNDPMFFGCSVSTSTKDIYSGVVLTYFHREKDNTSNKLPYDPVPNIFGRNSRCTNVPLFWSDLEPRLVFGA